MTLILENICKSFGRVKALDEVSLHVESGDCYGFLGHNGAGKTTAMRIALGLLRPDSGRVWLDGFDTARHRREALARMGGMIEAPSFYPWMDGRHNLRLLAEASGLSSRESVAEADRLLDMVGLAESGHRRVGGYSQGMRQRLGIAQALLASPSMILLDEPTNGLDPEGIEEIRRLIARLTQEQGITILLSSHQLAEVAGVCTRIGIIRKGHLLVEAGRDQLMAGGSRRYRLRTDRPWETCEKWLAARDLAVERADGDLILLDLASEDPRKVAHDLVSDGFGLEEFGPVQPSLEEIYLAYTRGEISASGADTASAAPVGVQPKPSGRRAPKWPMRRAWHAEMRVLLSRIGIWISLMLPAVFGLFALLRLWMQNRQNLADLSAGNLISTSSITAFEALGVFLQAALPAAGFILAGLASQSLAGEFSRGTILHIAIRPISRIQLAVGKFLGMLTAAAICFFLTLGVGWLAAATAFDFTDVVEIMEIKGAVPFVIVEAEKLQPVVYRMIAPLGLALAAYTGLGFLAGAMTTRNGLAIGLSAGLIVLLDLGRELVRVFTAESYLISAYFPSPLRDTSPVAQLLQLIRAPNDPQAGFPESALWIPLAWLLATVFLSAILLRRRSIR